MEYRYLVWMVFCPYRQLLRGKGLAEFQKSPNPKSVHAADVWQFPQSCRLLLDGSFPCSAGCQKAPWTCHPNTQLPRHTTVIKASSCSTERPLMLGTDAGQKKIVCAGFQFCRKCINSPVHSRAA